jgi:LysM repeat protein
MYSLRMNDVLYPVMPSKINTKIKNKNKVIQLINDGEVNILKSPGLTEIDFELLLPNQDYPFARYVGGFKNASYFLSQLEKLKTEMKPFSLSITRNSSRDLLLNNTEHDVSLEEYSILESADNGTDLVVKVKLKFYRDYGIERYQVKEGTNDIEIPLSAKNHQKRPKPEPAKTYTVKEGDTLWKICRRALNDGTKYKDVAKLNDISNPNLIQPGQVIMLG